MTRCRPRARLISITCRWRNGVELVRSCAIYRKRDGLKCGMRYSSQAVSEDQAIEAAKQARPKNDRSPRLAHLGYLGVIEIRRPHFNVLLNLYRYPGPARDDLIAAFRKLSPRIFVPYQAALEYQSGRVGTIASQLKRFDEVRKVLRDSENQLQAELGKLQLRKRHGGNQSRQVPGRC